MNIVFLVHGVGRHAAGWSSEPLQALDAAIQLHPGCLPSSKLADCVKVVEIRYDDLFDTVLDRWKQLAAALPAASGAFAWASKVSELLKKAGDDRNTFARFGGDVLLYCGFSLVARAVRLRISAAVAAAIYEEHAAATAEKRDAGKFALVAHSLGTAVAQDALYQLAKDGASAARENLAADVHQVAAQADLSQSQRQSLVQGLTGAPAEPPEDFGVNLDGLFLVSDTSPLLHQFPLYSELQRNGEYDCQAVWSVNHEFDPISIVGGAGAGPSRNDKKNVRVRHIHQENIHALTHYLSHPAVHCELFRLMIPAFSAACFQGAQQLATAAEWNGFGGKLAAWPEQKRAELKQKLRAAVRASPTVQKLQETIEQYFRATGLL